MLASVAGILGKHGVSVDHIAQRPRGEGRQDLIVVTHRCRADTMDAAKAALANGPLLAGPAAAFPIADESYF